MTSVKVKKITTNDDFSILTAHINDAMWDDANGINPTNYTVLSLREFVEHDRSVLLFAYIDNEFAGMTAATIQSHPHNTGRWLYIDEVDTAVNHRKKGVGTAMMDWCFKFAKQQNLYEVCLGTERDNKAARQLYESLKPDDKEDVIWYMYEVDDE